MTEIKTFQYIAINPAGESIIGTINGTGLPQARAQLESLSLQIQSISAVDSSAKIKPLSSSDFASFNQYLAQLTSSGMPLEQGLRLIATDLKSGRLADATRQLADDLDRGQSLSEAFGKHRSQFPPLYGNLVDAGIKANNLPAMLFNLGRHLELVNRLRGALWKAFAYPAAVTAAFFLLLTFLCVFVMPKLQEIFKGYGMRLPVVTQIILVVASLLPAILIILGCVAGVIILLMVFSSFSATVREPLRAVAFRLPLVGPILRSNLIARWCDAVQLGVAAGLDLPGAIQLATTAVDVPRLRSDAQQLTDALTAGQPLSNIDRPRILPATIPAVMQLASTHGNLPESLAGLAHMYQQEAELRLTALPSIIVPILITILAMMVGFVIIAMFAPLVALLQSLGGF
jgi:type IV pilus assembly protein PilC